MAVIGHVDHGKSTLMGHLLYLQGQVSKQQIAKNEKAAALNSKATFEYAYVMDTDEEERAHGITIYNTQAHFQTENRDFTIIDCPGHRDFIATMISGASQAECAILVVDSTKGKFESAFENGQTKDHAILARSLDVT